MNDQSIASFLEDVRGQCGTWVSEPAVAREVDRVEAFVGVRLPAAHRDLLLSANGIGTGWGYQRLFGVGDGSQDIGPWNAHETWKFAWPRPLDDFLSIGQTGWGDQFAYKLSDLRRGVETVHWLDHSLMYKADMPAAPTFAAFLEGFLRRACAPDEKTREARRQLGDLGRDELAVFSPSPLLVGLERATQLKRLTARDAMILNGDLTTQLTDPENQGARVARFDLFLDDRGRPRVHVEWTRAQRPVEERADAALADPELPWI
jgi:hypothetical protein